MACCLRPVAYLFSLPCRRLAVASSHCVLRVLCLPRRAVGGSGCRCWCCRSLLVLFFLWPVAYYLWPFLFPVPYSLFPVLCFTSYTLLITIFPLFVSSVAVTCFGTRYGSLSPGIVIFWN